MFSSLLLPVLISSLLTSPMLPQHLAIRSTHTPAADSTDWSTAPMTVSMLTSVAKVARKIDPTVFSKKHMKTIQVQHHIDTSTVTGDSLTVAKLKIAREIQTLHLPEFRQMFDSSGVTPEELMWVHHRVVMAIKLFGVKLGIPVPPELVDPDYPKVIEFPTATADINFFDAQMGDSDLKESILKDILFL